MATIQKRGAYWRAQVRRTGYRERSESFDTRQAAEAWARRVESEMDRGTWVDDSLAKKWTLGEALKKYELKIVPLKRYPYQERQRIRRWLEQPLALRPLGSLRGVHFAEYRDARRAEGRAENTIRLELQLVSHLFEIARKEWGMEGLLNPLNNIRKPSGSRARDRRLLPGEFERLYRLLQASLNPYAAPAFELAIETSLRQGTLFSLRWEWVDLKTRLVTFPLEARGAANKGVPAKLPLAHRAVAVLRHLAARWQIDILMDPEAMQFGPINVDPAALSGPVFGTSSNAVLCVWKRIVKREENLFHDLRWHDLRHESASRLFEKGMHPMEVASITGHRSMQMLRRYTHLNPSDLLEKLG